jgi:hypothetical protein
MLVPLVGRNSPGVCKISFWVKNGVFRAAGILFSSRRTCYPARLVQLSKRGFDYSSSSLHAIKGVFVGELIPVGFCEE